MPDKVMEAVDPAVLAALIDIRGVLLVDVREPDEYANERIKVAFLFPLSCFYAQRLPRLARDRVVFYSNEGTRAREAAERWLGAGHRSVGILNGGIERWKAVGLPTIGLDSNPTGEP